jgi:DNA-directed RNA polymerase subunit M/transcription elongation factor TFIIS
MLKRRMEIIETSEINNHKHLQDERFDSMGRSKKVRKCPRCGSKDMMLQDSFDDGVDLYVCDDCDYELEIGVSRSDRSDADGDIDSEFDQEQTSDGW